MDTCLTKSVLDVDMPEHQVCDLQFTDVVFQNL